MGDFAVTFWVELIGGRDVLMTAFGLFFVFVIVYIVYKITT